MRLKMGLNLTRNYSCNFDVKKRGKKNIKFIIVHYTGMKKEIKAIEKLKDYKSKVSSHYLIKKNGEILRLVPDLYIAWHAGQSSWKKLKSLNKYSIGIEISNPGHNYTYKSFSFKQIVSIKKLLNFLIKKYQIKLDNILGHSDIAPLRKLDPGEKFPWNFLSKKGVAIWYPKIKFKTYDTSLKARRKIFFRNIHKIGYRFFYLSKKSNNDRKIIMAFQRRFLPKEVNGKITDKTLQISQLLALNFNFT